MGAGSIIGAMGGEQSLKKMGGFRKAMPFTYGCFIIGGLALSGIPPFSGFFSKDEILLVTGERGGWHWGLYVAGYLGAFLTAIYTFRMIFLAFHGEPCPEARELEGGHLHHAEVPDQPRQRRGRGHRRRLPRTPSHDRRARAGNARGDERPRARRGRRRARADPEARLRDRRLPAPDVRQLAAVRTAHAQRPARVRADPRHRARARGDRARLPHLGQAAEHRRQRARAV